MGEGSSFSAFGDAIGSFPAIVIYAMGCISSCLFVNSLK